MRPLPAQFIRRLAGAVVLLGFAWTLVLAASPDLHEAAHHDAGDEHHECAVTLIHAGGIENSPAPTFSVVALPRVFANLGAPRLDWVPSLFSTSSVLEHAPPIRRGA